jgi:hypothetical protein
MKYQRSLRGARGPAISQIADCILARYRADAPLQSRRIFRKPVQATIGVPLLEVLSSVAYAIGPQEKT